MCIGVLDPPKDAADTNEDIGHGQKSQRTETLQSPLCALCAVECELDSLDEQGILQRGLKRIDLIDGGVTRRRWTKRPRDQLGSCWPSKATNEQLGHGNGDKQTDGKRELPMFWVNMNDPINGHSFRPYPSKPIPWHMQHVLEDDTVRSNQQSVCSGFPTRKQWIARPLERDGRDGRDGRDVRWKRHSEPCRELGY